MALGLTHALTEKGLKRHFDRLNCRSTFGLTHALTEKGLKLRAFRSGMLGSPGLTHALTEKGLKPPLDVLPLQMGEV